MKRVLVLWALISYTVVMGQEYPENIRTKILEVIADTTSIDSVSINPVFFELRDVHENLISSEQYKVDFSKAEFWFVSPDGSRPDKVVVSYVPFPDFMTRSYYSFDKALIVPHSADESRLFSAQSGTTKKHFKPFQGLHTTGSLSRGVTMGNNQDAVVNSNFNLQIEGMLSEKVGIRASITDNEIPLQAGGYTQRLNEFDRVYIELFSDNWSVVAGDIDLMNQESYLMRFQKKISGLSVKGNVDHNNGSTNFFASGALVKGKFHSYQFVGQDANQGPYRILGPENQQLIIMISGSERVYANGVLLKRGENFDYTIDYNTGEITFTSLYSVSSNLRFTVEYQLSERNYTRFMTYDGVQYKTDKFRIGMKYFNETDSKNNPVDQNLSEEQKQILSEAGDNPLKMISPSEEESEYHENRVLYKKIVIDGVEVFEYSINPEDELYQVSFSYVGENNGDYFLQTTLGTGRVYSYIPPDNGARKGSYLPVVKLVAPEKLQLLNIEAAYRPSQKTEIHSELAISDKDKNLFSQLDDEDNKGLAAVLRVRQNILNQKWKLDADANFEYVDENFRTIERIRNVEFARDWNIPEMTRINPSTQQHLKAGLDLDNDSTATFKYRYESLRLGDQYRGQRHGLIANIESEKTHVYADGSWLSNESLLENNAFQRWYSGITQEISKFWIGAKLNFENNQRKIKSTGAFNPMSHRFVELEGFAGVGDSTQVFTEIGYNFRETDSVYMNRLEGVSRANTIFVKSRLIKSSSADLSLYGQYRQVDNKRAEDEEVLNGRLNYRQQIYRNFISLQTVLETKSGTLPQQEFTYVEVEPGKGYYEWIDFNENGIQELDEFVVARFQDQAIYVRVLLPTVQFIRTNQNKWSQSLNLNARAWHSQTGLKKVLSYFSNQTYFLIDAKRRREGAGFQVSPFADEEDNLLGLDQNFKNSFFFNRGLQTFSVVYTYLNHQKKTIYSFGDQEVKSDAHQWQFVHKLGTFWLFDAEAALRNHLSESKSYRNRNYDLEVFSLGPKISYLRDKNTRLDFYYTYKDKNNTIGEQESLEMHLFGINFQWAKKQSFSCNANANLYLNDFQGQTNSPVAYQMLEGLQPGTNITWLLGMQKRLTSFLDLNLHYTGRTSVESKTIHTGNIQLRATF